MRRSLILTAFILAACAKSDQAATDTAAMAPPPAPPPRTIALADVAGTWDAKAMPMDRDTVLTNIQLVATGTMQGWSMKMSSGENVPLTVAPVSGDSIVAQSGQFKSVLRKGQNVSVRNVVRLQDGKLVGVVHAKYANGDTANLRLEGTKKP